ncbi:MAG TPA: hypothetical protein VH702_03195 [Vicinamibacterales bacterium]
MDELRFTVEEQRVIDQALAERSTGSAPGLSVAQLIERWERFVHEIARGYEFTIYDYTNDLALRDIIQILLQLGPSIAGKLTPRVTLLDDLFRESTVEITRPIRRVGDVSTITWWYRRVPKRAGEDLLADLRFEGFDKP